MVKLAAIQRQENEWKKEIGGWDRLSLRNGIDQILFNFIVSVNILRELIPFHENEWKKEIGG